MIHHLFLEVEHARDAGVGLHVVVFDLFGRGADLAQDFLELGHADHPLRLDVVIGQLRLAALAVQQPVDIVAQRIQCIVDIGRAVTEQFHQLVHVGRFDRNRSSHISSLPLCSNHRFS